MMFRPADITNAIIDAARVQGRQLTPLQIVKLAFIGHGWWLHFRREPLVADTAQAWKYGPVFPSIYKKLKSFGRGTVGQNVPAGIFEPGAPITPEASAFVAQLVQNYGSYDGLALSNLTHQPGTPWSQVYRPNVLNIDIPDNLIASHYDQLAAQRQAAAE